MQSIATLSGKKILIPYPKTVDCIVGNPPYTRQEEITEITGKETYKESLIDKALFEGKRKLADISKRAGIHAYFFVHGTKFLKEDGRFGFIVSNSWMDVDYGKGLQELFLNNYKIIAIIESKVERWFEDADVNTCIIILERCKDQKERDENLVRFVYLFKPLRHFIPPAHDIWEKQKQRLDAIENLVKTILRHNNFYQTDEYRIYPKKQSELWEEGFDVEENKYTGSKWGKYLRATEIFFKILEKGKDKLVPLKEIADVRRGFTTGANEFFYLTEDEIKERGIEKEFWMHKDENGKWVPNKVALSLRECSTLTFDVENSKYRMLIIESDKGKLKGKNILKFIQRGEALGYDKRPTCSSRKNWYQIGDRKPFPILFSQMMGDRFMVVYNPSLAYVDHNFHEICPRNNIYQKALVAVLNSTVSSLFRELYSYLFTGSINITKMDTWSVEKFLTLNVTRLPKKRIELLERSFNNISSRPLEHTLKELGANHPDEVSLGKVKPDRLELDRTIMGDILGLTEDEQLEVYRAVVDLVRSRIEKAGSFGKKGKTKEGFDIELLTRTIKEKLGDKLLGNFYREKILNQKKLKTVKLFQLSKEISIKNELFGWSLSSGKEHIDCRSEAEAEYLKIWLEAGLDEVKVPKDENYLSKILPELKTLKEKIDQIIADHLSSITSQKLQQKILQKLQGELFK